MTHHLMSSWPVAVQSGERGRSAVLTAPVQAGDLISSCPCYAVAVDPEWLESVCVGCASLSKTPLSLRCEECKGAFYCSPACRDGPGGERHRPVCGWEAAVVAALRKADARAAVALSPEPYEETTVRLVLAAVLTHAEAESDAALPRTREWGSPTYRDVLQQCSHPAQLPERTRQLAALAHAAFAKVLPPATAPSAAEVLGLFARDECNGFGFWTKDYERFAVGLVPGAAMFNHSCCPNAAKVQSADFRVEVRALRPLSAGEEVTFSYVPLCDGLQERQAVLTRHFNFACDCARCEAEADGEPHAPPPYAHHCGGVLYPAASRGVLRTPVLRCSICRRDLPRGILAPCGAAPQQPAPARAKQQPPAPSPAPAELGRDAFAAVTSETPSESLHEAVSAPIAPLPPPKTISQRFKSFWGGDAQPPSAAPFFAAPLEDDDDVGTISGFSEDDFEGLSCEYSETATESESEAAPQRHTAAPARAHASEPHRERALAEQL